MLIPFTPPPRLTPPDPYNQAMDTTLSSLVPPTRPTVDTDMPFVVILNEYKYSALVGYDALGTNQIPKVQELEFWINDYNKRMQFINDMLSSGNTDTAKLLQGPANAALDNVIAILKNEYEFCFRYQGSWRMVKSRSFNLTNYTSTDTSLTLICSTEFIAVNTADTRSGIAAALNFGTADTSLNKVKETIKASFSQDFNLTPVNTTNIFTPPSYDLVDPFTIFDLWQSTSDFQPAYRKKGDTTWIPFGNGFQNTPPSWPIVTRCGGPDRPYKF